MIVWLNMIAILGDIVAFGFCAASIYCLWRDRN